MPRLYRAVDAFVLPTRGEGWGLPRPGPSSHCQSVITRLARTPLTGAPRQKGTETNRQKGIAGGFSGFSPAAPEPTVIPALAGGAGPGLATPIVQAMAMALPTIATPQADPAFSPANVCQGRGRLAFGGL